jgi:GNAT superfamily N-acetyltransferase
MGAQTNVSALAVVGNRSVLDREPVIVTKRRPTSREVAALIGAIRSSPNITGYTAAEWTGPGPVFVAEDAAGEFLGACLHDDFTTDFTEIAVIFVFEQHRGKGVGRALFDASCIDLQQRRRNALLIFRDEAIDRMARGAAFAVFPCLSALDGPYRGYASPLKTGYKLHWLANPYRLLEIARKRIVFGTQPGFRYGLKLFADQEMECPWNQRQRK